MTASASRRVPRAMAITAADAPLDRRFEGWLADLAGAGFDAVQVRRKELGDRDLLALVERARDALAGTELALLVNGRPDVALAAGTDARSVGVHLPASGLPTAEVRRLLAARGGANAPVGRSAHRAAEIVREAALGPDGPDYLLFGPVFETPGKAAVGPGALAGACAAGVPVLAVGGIGPERVAEAAVAGAAGVAAIRACRDRGAMEALAAAVREAFPAAAAGRNG